MGRKKLGNVLFARRLRPDQVEAIERMLAGGEVEACLKEKLGGLKEAIPANPRANEVKEVSRPTFEEAVRKVGEEREVLMLRLRISEMEDNEKKLRGDNRLLLDSIEKLEDEVRAAREEMAKVRGESVDERVAYWKARCLKAEDFARKNSNL